jgi:hypothetical protein
MSIPSIALAEVLRILEEIGFVKLVEKGRKIERIIPDIPVFDDVYNGLGEYANAECTLNSHEQATLQILTELQKAPQNKDKLFNSLGIEKPLFDRCINIGNSSGMLSEHRARGRPIIISPFYFADNLDGLADAAAAAGASAIQSTLSKVKDNQGWPLSLVGATGEIGGRKLPPTEISLIHKLAEEGVLKPPTIKFGTKSESFLSRPDPAGLG